MGTISLTSSNGQLDLHYSDSLYSQCIYVRQLKTLFDLGDFNTDIMSGIKQVFLTHCHLDHILHGCVKLAIFAKKAKKKITLYAQKNDCDKIKSLFRALAEFDNIPPLFDYIEIKSLKKEENIIIKNDFYVKPFKTDHIVPSNGYTVYQRHTHLKKEYNTSNERTLQNLVINGEKIEEIDFKPFFTYTGDTLPHTLFQDHILKSEILITECAFEQASLFQEKFKHVAVEHIKNLLDAFEGRNLIVVHTNQKVREKLSKIEDNRLIYI